MDSLPTTNDLSAKGAGLSSLLSSLGALLGGNSGTSGLFANLLEEQQVSGNVSAAATGLAPAPAIDTSDTSDATSQNIALPNAGSSTGGGNALKLIRSLVSELHHTLAKLNKNSKTQTQNQQQTGNANNTNNNSNTASGANAATVTGASDGSTDTSNVSSTDGSDGVSPTDTKTLKTILAELLQLMQTMEKRLEAAVSANDGTASAATPAVGNDNADPTGQADASGQASAADPLTQMLALLQQIQQSLGGDAGDAAGTSTTDASGGATADITSVPGSNPTASALATLAQIQKDLKTLMDSLNPANGNATTGDGTNSSVAGVADALNVSASAANSGVPVAPPAKAAWANDDFLNLFGSAAGNASPSTGPATFNPAGFLTGDKNGVSSDTGSQDGTSFTADDSPADTGSATNSGASLAGFVNTTNSADPYAFASQLSAARAANGGAAGLPDVVEQVLLQINRGVKDGNDQMTIQLQPAELGKINIKLDISSDGKVQGTVTADNPSTLNLLLKDVRGLERALQEAGLRADPGGLQFSLGGQSGNTSGQMVGNSGSNTSSGSDASSTGGTPLDLSTDTAETFYVTPGRVNFKV